MGEAGSDAAWRRYFEATQGRPPRETLLFALGRCEAEGRAPGFAVDLACGAGRDTVELLRRGWRVRAIDREPAAIAALSARPDLPATAALETEIAALEDAQWPDCDLVNASFALPLCAPESFPALWQRIVAALRPGGRFAGQLYGERDGWAGRPGITTHSRAEAEALLAALDVELLREEETDSITPRGKPKHWHIFHVVARRR